MDRDWASRKYIPISAFRQRSIWGVSMLVSIAVIDVLDGLGYPRDSAATLTVFAIGGTGMFTIIIVSFIVGQLVTADRTSKRKQRQST